MSRNILYLTRAKLRAMNGTKMRGAAKQLATRISAVADESEATLTQSQPCPAISSAKANVKAPRRHLNLPESSQSTLELPSRVLLSRE